MAVYSGADPNWAQYFDLTSGALFLGILLYCSQPFYQSAFSSLRSRSASIDLPIALSILIGAFISYLNLIRSQGDVYFDSISMLVFLILTSRYILSVFQQNLLAPSYFKEFFKLDKVVRWKNHQRDVVTPEEVQVNDQLAVEVNEVFPVDAVLLKDDVWVDSSVVTGEFMPELRHCNEKVMAGEKCLSENVIIRAVSTARGSQLGQLMDEVEDQLLKRTPMISLADKVAQYFTLFILILGGVFCAVYMSVNVSEAINRSLALVIVACPCALAFAIPLAQSLSLSKLAKAGILVKKAETLEKLNQVNTVVFDKTGTLSKGQLCFLGWEGLEPSVLEKTLIYNLEKKSKHPVARAFRSALESFSSKGLEIDHWNETPGEGVEGVYKGEQYSVKAAPESNDKIRRVGFYKGAECLAVAKFDDVEKVDSKQTIENLSDLGLETYIISGDVKASVENFSKRLNVPAENVLAKMSPRDKEKFIRNHPLSAMVGDGANDLLALTGSYVSVAVKGSMEASLRVADVYITQEGVGGVEELISAARNSMRVIRKNLVISASYNFLGASAALMGWVSPLVAAVLMPSSTFVVVILTIYGVRKRRMKKNMNSLMIKTVPVH